MTVTSSSNCQSRTITIAKGIGIIMVVIGHYYPNQSPLYWELIRKFIYGFHMPLFLILSGYLFSKYHDTQKLNLSFLKKKFTRLIIPFISIAIFAFAIKFVAGQFYTLRHPVSVNSFMSIFITSKGTYFPLLWFLYSLFIIFTIYPILNLVLRSKFLIFFISILLLFINWPRYFYLNHVFVSFPFFCFGALFSRQIDFDTLENRKLIYLLLIGTILLTFTYFFAMPFIEDLLYIKVTKLIIGISGSLTIISLAAILNKGLNLNHFLYVIGFYSMSIYLLHTIFSSSISIINYQILKTNYFIIPALFGITIGIFLPLLLEMHVLRKYPITRKYILGLSSTSSISLEPKVHHSQEAVA
jgi:fucose 4-O-acetylase-like acetyltransferase